MVQRARCARFLFESAHALSIVRKGVWQDFDRNVTAQPRIAAAIDATHPAFSQQRVDFVRSDVRQR